MVEKKHFVLVHGAAHGAWCWYRIVDLLQKAGHKVSTLDLASAGMDSTDPNKVASARELAAPLLSLLEALPESEKVILVAHSMGGLSATIAMEQFPEKIAVTVMLAALMLTDLKHKRLDEVLKLFLHMSADRQRDGAVQFFSEGPGLPPTSAKPDLEHVVKLFYHLSPSEDVALAKVCLKWYPVWLDFKEFFPPQTAERYGSVPRVYIECDADHAILPSLVDLMCEMLPPKQRLSIHSDHSPFFSAPHDLLHHLLKIVATFTARRKRPLL